MSKTELPVQPDAPTFEWELLESTGNESNVRVNWIPKMKGHPGSSFYVDYCLIGEDNWTKTWKVVNNHSTVVTGLLRGKAYDMKVISVNGKFEAESDVQTVKTHGFCKFI